MEDTCKEDRVKFLHELTLEAQHNRHKADELYLEVEDLINKECHRYTNIGDFEDIKSLANIAFCKAVRNYKAEYSVMGIIPLLKRSIYLDVICYNRDSAKKHRGVGSINETLYIDSEGNGLTIEDTLVSPIDIEEETINKSWLDIELSKLKPKEQFIVQKVFIEQMTQLEVSSMLNLSQAQVSRIRKRALQKLKKGLRDIQGGSTNGKTNKYRKQR